MTIQMIACGVFIAALVGNTYLFLNYIYERKLMGKTNGVF